jgi:hypothetical protein
MHTYLLKVGNGLVVLSVQLRPLREVVLRRRVPKLTLQLHDLLLQLLRLLCRAGRRRRELVIQYP